jgi:hypothetical protein
MQACLSSSPPLSLCTEERASSFTQFCDNEPSMTQLNSTAGSFGAKLSTAGIKSNHICRLDRKIRLVKDCVRSILAGLPYSWPGLLIRFPLLENFSPEGKQIITSTSESLSVSTHNATNQSRTTLWLREPSGASPSFHLGTKPDQ